MFYVLACTRYSSSGSMAQTFDVIPNPSMIYCNQKISVRFGRALLWEFSDTDGENGGQLGQVKTWNKSASVGLVNG